MVRLPVLNYLPVPFAFAAANVVPDLGAAAQECDWYDLRLGDVFLRWLLPCDHRCHRGDLLHGAWACRQSSVSILNGPGLPPVMVGGRRSPVFRRGCAA